jgi:hypothetical protein
MCEDACDLAVWRALRWLIALAGRDSLGVDARTIAAHAKVDVKTALRCINGDRSTSRAKRRPRTPKRGLVSLGLLEIAGHQSVGKLQPRPVYRIPRWIEEQNAHHTRVLLIRLGVEPPAPAPPAEQVRLPLELVPHVEQTSAAGPHVDHEADRTSGPPDPHVEQADVMNLPVDQRYGWVRDVPDPYVDQADVAADPHLDQADFMNLPLDQQYGWVRGVPDPYAEQRSRVTPHVEQRFGWVRDVPDPHVDQAAGFAVPHVDRWRDGAKDGGREGGPPPYPALHTEPQPAAPPPQRLGSLPPPVAPPDALADAHPLWVPSTLPAHPFDLWRRACPNRRLIDDDQLAVLASEHDRPTSGFGWYWVGRAILAAALSEDIHSVAKVRRTLERWRAEDSYGSDAPITRRPAAPRGARGADAPAVDNRPLSVRLGVQNVFKEY